MKSSLWKERAIMNNIESIYLNYDRIFSEFSEEVIQGRYTFLYKECIHFLDSMNLKGKVRIDETILMHTVLDYFSDVSRLKSFHKIFHINEIKVISYETYWLLRRKPLQVIKEETEGDSLSFINEKFAFSRIAAFLVHRQGHLVLNDIDKKSFLNYLDTLYYFLKYRQYDPQVLELMILGFRAGELIGKNAE